MSTRRVLLSCDPDTSWEGAVEFMLTYEGPLRATQRDSRPGQPSCHIENKHVIRRAFHTQLKELWRTSRALQDLGTYWQDDYPDGQAPGLHEIHSHYGWGFIPLVTQKLDLLCSIEVLLLRPDRPGHVVWAGDIDNRLKTLLDAMRVPKPSEQYSTRAPGADESPLFVLLEDDKLVTRVAVQTERLLSPVTGDEADVRLFIEVKIKPYNPDFWNRAFGYRRMAMWQPVLDLFAGGYAPGFDRHELYEFKRVTSEEISVFRMVDQHPSFNIANLFWRPLPQ